MCNFTQAFHEQHGGSRPPRAEDICALFAGVHCLVSAVRDWRSGQHRRPHPLAAIDDSQIGDLSEIGRRLHREHRRQLRLSHGSSH